MRYRIMLAVVGIAASLIYLLGSPQDRRIAAAAGSEEQAIQKQIDAYVQAFNKADVAGVVAIWTAEGEYVDESGKSTKGRESLSAMFAKAFELNKGIKVQIKTNALRIAKEDVAIQDGVASLTRHGGETENSPFSAVWIKKEDKWLLFLVRDASAQSGGTVEAPGNRLRDLGWLVGDWVHEDKEKKTNVSAHWMKGEKFLVIEFTVHHTGQEVFEVKQVIGWDPTGDQLRSWVFDTRGGFGEGNWSRNGNTWTVESAGITADGRHGSGQNQWTFVDDKSFQFQATDREIDGKALPDVKITYQRTSK